MTGTTDSARLDGVVGNHVILFGSVFIIIIIIIIYSSKISKNDGDIDGNTRTRLTGLKDSNHLQQHLVA